MLNSKEALTANNWGAACFFIAEAGLNHNGDFDQAMRLIEVASDSGADCVKFQKRNVDKLATDSVLDAPDGRFPSLGSTYRQIRERHEFNVNQFSQLRRHAEDLGLVFMVTPFDLKSYWDLREAGVEYFKVASHGVTNYPLLEALATGGHPVVLSSGMSTLEELDRAVDILSSPPGNLAGILHCVSSYPTPLEEINLRLIQTLSSRYEKRTGYSGHELGVLPTIAAVAAGATIVERHFTLDTSQEGFDHHMSLDPSGLSELISAIRDIEKMFGDGVKQVIESERVAREKYRLSLVAAVDVSAGETLRPEDTEFRNPGTGIPPGIASDYFGRKLRNSVAAGEMILAEDFFD